MAREGVRIYRADVFSFRQERNVCRSPGGRSFTDSSTPLTQVQHPSASIIRGFDRYLPILSPLAVNFTESGENTRPKRNQATNFRSGNIRVLITDTAEIARKTLEFLLRSRIFVKFHFDLKGIGIKSTRLITFKIRIKRLINNQRVSQRVYFSFMFFFPHFNYTIITEGADRVFKSPV